MCIIIIIILKQQRDVLAVTVRPRHLRTLILLSASRSGIQHFLAPAVFQTLAPNVQSLSLNARNFLISEPVLWQPFAE